MKISSVLLKKAVSLVSRFVAQKSPEVSFQSIKVSAGCDGLVLFAMNPSMSFCEATIKRPCEEEFSFYVNGEKLYAAINASRGEEIELSLKNDKVTIKFDGGKAAIPVLGGEDIRSIPNRDEPFLFSVDPELLKERLAAVSVASARNAQFAVGGIVWDEGRAIVYATDTVVAGKATTQVAWGDLASEVESSFPAMVFSHASFGLMASCCVGSTTDVHADNKRVRLVSHDDDLCVEAGCGQEGTKAFPMRQFMQWSRSAVFKCKSIDFFSAVRQMCVAMLPEVSGAIMDFTKDSIAMSLESSEAQAESSMACECSEDIGFRIKVCVESLAAAAKCFPSKEYVFISFWNPSSLEDSEPNSVVIGSSDGGFHFMRSLMEMD